MDPKPKHLHFVTFGGGKGWREAAARLSRQAELSGVFKTVTCLCDLDIFALWPDFEMHRPFVEGNSRGFGYWIWKPFIITKMLQQIPVGDALFYFDSGCEILPINSEKLGKLLGRVYENNQFILDYSSYGIFNIVFWSKQILIEWFLEHKGLIKIDHIPKRSAGTVGFVRDADGINIKFASEWFDICVLNKYRLVDDSVDGLPRHYHFFEHRHDQAIFSLLAHSYNFKSIGNAFDFAYRDADLNECASLDDKPFLVMRNFSGKSLAVDKSRSLTTRARREIIGFVFSRKRFIGETERQARSLTKEYGLLLEENPLAQYEKNAIVDLAYYYVLGRLPEKSAVDKAVAVLGREIDLLDLMHQLKSSPEALGVERGEIGILGTDKTLTRFEWDQKVASKLGAIARPKNLTPNSLKAPMIPNDVIELSAIASMYKGERYIESFLDNIVSQSSFNRSELIIIDADSPEKEYRIIEKYQKNFANIVYRRCERRIGIYDAWNDAIALARGIYITNTNLDDLRSVDSFEAQLRGFENGADVCYQNFYYSLNDEMSFEQISNVGFVSNLPLFTGMELVKYNAPHNAPVWRRSLHDEIGFFDTSFKSAGDWDFWIRCYLAGKKFHRQEYPSVSYYVNPEGLSTSPSGTSNEEEKWVRMRHKAFFERFRT